FLDLWRYSIIAQFDKQIPLGGNGVALGMKNGVFNVVVGEVEIAPDAKRKPIANLLVQCGKALSDTVTVVGINLVRMRCRDDMRDPVLNCQTTHLSGHLPGFGAVVKARENVAVDVNHCRDRHFDNIRHSRPGMKMDGKSSTWLNRVKTE